MYYTIQSQRVERSTETGRLCRVTVYRIFEADGTPRGGGFMSEVID